MWCAAGDVHDAMHRHRDMPITELSGMNNYRHLLLSDLVSIMCSSLQQGTPVTYATAAGNSKHCLVCCCRVQLLETDELYKIWAPPMDVGIAV